MKFLNYALRNSWRELSSIEKKSLVWMKDFLVSTVTGCYSFDIKHGAPRSIGRHDSDGTLTQFDSTYRHLSPQKHGSFSTNRKDWLELREAERWHQTIGDWVLTDEIRILVGDYLVHNSDKIANAMSTKLTTTGIVKECTISFFLS